MDPLTVAFDKAHDFLDYLQPRNDRWHPHQGLSPWVFRGQADAAWDLEPSAWRENSEQWFADLIEAQRGVVTQLLRQHEKERSNTSEPFEDEQALRMGMQALAEGIVIQDFVELADELGEPIPEIPPYHPRYLVSRGLQWCVSHGKNACPPLDNFFWSNATTAAALAQHHGVPTRLLDWTRSPFKAAFFAGEEERSTGEGRLAVWALRADVLQASSLLPNISLDQQFSTLVCPRNQISYLHYQDGLFTYPMQAEMHLVFRKTLPSLRGTLETMIRDEIKGGVLYKLTLPWSERKALLDLLWRERITRAHLTRTFDNVTRSLSMRYRVRNESTSK